MKSLVVDRGFELLLGQTKDYKIGVCCFSAKHAPIRSKINDLFAQNQNNVFEWSLFGFRQQPLINIIHHLLPKINVCLQQG
jgi:hypothetical protein